MFSWFSRSKNKLFFLVQQIIFPGQVLFSWFFLFSWSATSMVMNMPRTHFWRYNIMISWYNDKWYSSGFYGSWPVGIYYIIIRLVKIFRPVIYFRIILSDYFRIKARRRRKFLRFLPIYFANLICKNPSIDQGEVFDRGRGVCLFVCGAPAPPSGLYGLRPHTSWRLMGPLWLQEKIT